jgi:phosphoglycolate phosphatase
MSNLLSQASGCVIFDLDGTLIDSIGDITDCVNTIRRQRSASDCSAEIVRAAVGHGARVLCEKILPDILRPDESIDDLFLEFRSIYIEIANDHSRDIHWLPGSLDLLDHLRGLNIPRAILTNKPRSVTEALMPRLDQHGPWAAVVCPEDAGAPKPDPSGLISILEKLNCPVEQTLLVGDSAVDFMTGINAGVRTVGCRGGYGTATPPEPDLWVDDLAQLIPR